MATCLARINPNKASDPALWGRFAGSPLLRREEKAIAATEELACAGAIKLDAPRDEPHLETVRFSFFPLSILICEYCNFGRRTAACVIAFLYRERRGLPCSFLFFVFFCSFPCSVFAVLLSKRCHWFVYTAKNHAPQRSLIAM